MHQERYAMAGYGSRLPGVIHTVDGRHEVRWQPKFADPSVAVTSLDPDRLIETLRSAGPVGVRVAEFAQHAEPGQTAVGRCLSDVYPGDIEFWLLGASEEATGRLSEAFGQGARGGPARFAVADLADPASVSFTGGLLREAACDLVIADARTAPLTEAAWRVVRRLLVPGGLALIRHASAVDAPAEAGWTRLAVADGYRKQAALWAAPAVLFNDTAAEPRGPRWVIAGETGLADMWAWWMVPSAGRVAMESLGTEWLWSAQAREEMRGLCAVDFFCDDMGDSDPDGDPLDDQVVARCLEFVCALNAARGGIDAPCRVTVVTRRAAFDGASPRPALRWSAVRELGHELAAGIDLRLVDVGEPTDLTALRWLARHDVRERELAVRDGRLYAPWLVTPQSLAAAGVGAGGAGGIS
jgi:hypothetical protein